MNKKSWQYKLIIKAYYNALDTVLTDLNNFDISKKTKLFKHIEEYIHAAFCRDKIYVYYMDIDDEYLIMNDIITNHRYLTKYNFDDIYNISGPVYSKNAELRYVEYLLFKLVYEMNLDEETLYEFFKTTGKIELHIMRDRNRIQNSKYPSTYAKTNAFIFEKVFGDVLRNDEALREEYKQLLSEMDLSEDYHDYVHNVKLEKFINKIVDYYSIDDFLNEMKELVEETDNLNEEDINSLSL